MQERRRRILRISLAVLFGALCVGGAGGAAAVYYGPEELLGLSAEKSGADCQTVATAKARDRDGIWIRQFIVTEPVDEQVRIRTALRVAESLRKLEAGHLIQISVLDSKGPTTVSGMRGRAIGAQVILIPSPVSDAEKQKGEFSGFSIEGGAGSDGEFHGLRFNAKPEDLAAIAAGIDDATGCSNDLEMPAPAKS